MRIMYVEDNAINLGLVRRIAKMGNHDVISHANGPDALKALEIEQVDLILMDIELEGEMDGIEVVKRLRARGDKRPIVAVTAYAMVGDKERILAAGCNGYLPKPLPVAQFLQILAKYDPANAPKLATQEISTVKTEPQAPTTPTKKSDEVSKTQKKLADQPSASEELPSPIETKSTPSSISAPPSENAQKSTPIEKDADTATASTSSTASTLETSQSKEIEKTSVSPTSEPTAADTSAVAAQPESTEETTPPETTATPEKSSSNTVQSTPPPSTKQE